MLQALRSPKLSWLATGILGLLLIPFALFGIEDYVQGRQDTYVARIQSPPSWWAKAPNVWPFSKLWTTVDVSQQDFRRDFDALRERMRRAQGDAFDSQQFESADNKRKVLDDIINERVMGLAAQRAGVLVPDSAVREDIRNTPAFQGANGQFDMRTYQTLLEQNHITPAQYEAMRRDALQVTALTGRLASTNFVTPAEFDRFVQMRFQNRSLVSTVVPKAAPDSTPVSDADLQAWFSTHSAQYAVPARATFEVVDGDPAKAQGANIDEAALRQRYERDKSKYVGNDQRQAAHILVAVPKDADAAKVAAAKAKAEALAEQARKPGADFAALARANSDDAGSKASGGDLGWVAHDGTNVKPFEDALFALKPNEVSAPVRSDFGFHVILLRGTRGGKVTTFEEAKPELQKALAAEQSSKLINTGMGLLTDEAYKNPANFAKSAQALKLPLETVGPVGRGEVTGVLAQPAVARVVFQDAFLKAKGVSDPITVAPGHLVMVHVLDYTPSRPRTLQEAREQVIADIHLDRADKAAQARADALVKAVNGGRTLAEAAAAEKLTATPAPQPLPRGQMPTPEINQAVFAVPPPAAGKQSAGKIRLPDGNWLVFAVTGTTSGGKDAIPADAQSEVRNQMALAQGDTQALDYARALRKQLTIKVAEDRL